MIILRDKEFSFLGSILGKLKTVGHYISGKISQLFHKNSDKSHLQEAKKEVISEQKSFSDIYDYSDLIPGYYTLWTANDVCRDAIAKLDIVSSSSDLKIFMEEFPYISIMSPNTIDRWRQDYKNDGDGDWSEIIFMYGTELTYIWDFERKNWYVKDSTYNPAKEFYIGSNEKSIVQNIINSFDPEKDTVLGDKIKDIRKRGKGTEIADKIEKYCEIVRDSLKQ